MKKILSEPIGVAVVAVVAVVTITAVAIIVVVVASETVESGMVI